MPRRFCQADAARYARERFPYDEERRSRVVLTHRGSFQIQTLHVHPRFSPDGKQILFASDMSGYGNVYLIDTPDFDSLPELEDPEQR